MTHILLCDDEEEILTAVEKIILEYQKEKCCNEKIKISKYSDPQKLLRFYADNDGTLIFLDIGLTPITGIELAEKIRIIDNKATIIFLTGFNQYTQKAFDVHAFQYLVKPITKTKLWTVLDDYFNYRHENSNTEKEYFTLKNTFNDILVETELILYFEQYRNQTYIVLENNTITIYATLKEIDLLLPTHFYKCHKSYIINLKKIVKRMRDKCCLTNGFELPIGRVKQTEFKEKYYDFLEEYNKLLK